MKGPVRISTEKYLEIHIQRPHENLPNPVQCQANINKSLAKIFQFAEGLNQNIHICFTICRTEPYQQSQHAKSARKVGIIQLNKYIHEHGKHERNR